MTYDADVTQRKAARVVGFTYLFGPIPAIFAEFVVLGQIVVSNNAVEAA